MTMKTPPDANAAPPADARRIVRCAGRAALATLDRETGHPYASLVAIATMPDGAPVLLLSRLALHTRNIAADPRASLLVDAGGVTDDPLAAARVTLIGAVLPAGAGSAAERRFLAQHPAAAGYAGFADFGYFVLRIDRAHYVGGFGRIASLAAADLLLDVSGAADLISAEPELIATLNRDHADGLSQLGERLSGGRAGPWRATGIDPAGCDLELANVRCRCEFPHVVTTPDRAREIISNLLESTGPESPRRR